MSNINSAMLQNETSDIITEIINELYIIAKFHNINIPQDYIKESIEEIVVFYEKYLICFESRFCNIDFYKIACWFCVIMATKMYNFYKSKNLENKNWIALIIIYIKYLFIRLRKDGYILKEKNYDIKIMKMVVLEIKGKNDFGIGKNGLYMLFKIATLIDKS